MLPHVGAIIGSRYRRIAFDAVHRLVGIATAAVLLLVVLGAMLAPRWATLRFGIGDDRAGPPKGLDFDKLTPDEQRRVLDG
jgi:hypothetical protein